MKNVLDTLARAALFGCTVFYWLWLPQQHFASTLDLLLIVGFILLVVPVVWIGRLMLGKEPGPRRLAWATTFVHFALMFLLGTAIIRAVVTYQGWIGWMLPIPKQIGWALAVVTGIASVLTVINLAIKGLGAPFAIALTRRLTSDWMYAWTRNPMVLAGLAFLVSLGLWFQSGLFVAWAVGLVTPAWLVFLKVYEERELELRFGDSYLEYKARTPMLIPRRPGR